MKTKNLIYVGTLILMGFHVQVQPVAAALVPFTIDPARSIISLSGNVVADGLSLAFGTQGTGSLTTSYTGSILVDLSLPNIQFPGGSTITADTNGIWQPGVGGRSGSDPADYGGKISGLVGLITGNFAGRNMQFDVTSPAETLTNGGFNSGLLTVTFRTNSTPAPTVDYNVTVTGDSGDDTSGTSALIGAASNIVATGFLTNAFNVTNVAQKLTLRIPVNITNVSTVSGDVITVILTGTMVATAPSTDWPLHVTSSVQAGQLTLSWPSIPGQSFTVQTTRNLDAAWTTAPGPLTVNANTTTWTGEATNSAQFFRVLASY
jgi:hypothetical protein